MRRSALPGRWIVWLFALLLALPILVVISAPLHTPSENWSHALKFTLPDQLFGTLRLMFGSTLIALLFGTFTAWCVSNYEFFGRSVLKWALVLPLGLPTYIAAYTYGDLLGPTGTWSLALSGLIRIDIMNEAGLMLVLASVLYPYVYLPTRALFSFGSGQLQEAATTLGAGQWRVFTRIALPLARPALAGGALLVCMEVMNDYGAVKFFGIQTLTTGIFKSWFNMGDLGTALRIGTLLLLVVGVLRFIERRQQAGKDRSYTPHQTGLRRLSHVRSIWALIACSIPLVLGAGIPMLKIILDLVDGHWAKAMEYDLMGVLGNTIMLASLAAVFALLVALAFNYALRYGRNTWTKHLTSFASLGYVIPGAVIAVGVMTIAGVYDRHLGGVLLIGSLGLMAFALVVRFLAVAAEPLRAGSSAIEPSLAEAAATLRAGPLRSFLRIDIPLLKRSLIVSGLLVFIEVVKELPLTLILRPFNFDTLATKAFELASIELLQESSAAAALIVICSMVPVLLLERSLSTRH